MTFAWMVHKSIKSVHISYNFLFIGGAVSFYCFPLLCLAAGRVILLQLSLACLGVSSCLLRARSRSFTRKCKVAVTPLTSNICFMNISCFVSVYKWLFISMPNHNLNLLKTFKMAVKLNLWSTNNVKTQSEVMAIRRAVIKFMYVQAVKIMSLLPRGQPQF